MNRSAPEMASDADFVYFADVFSALPQASVFAMKIFIDFCPSADYNISQRETLPLWAVDLYE